MNKLFITWTEHTTHQCPKGSQRLWLLHDRRIYIQTCCHLYRLGGFTSRHAATSTDWEDLHLDMLPPLQIRRIYIQTCCHLYRLGEFTSRHAATSTDQENLHLDILPPLQIRRIYIQTCCHLYRFGVCLLFVVRCTQYIFM